MMLVASTKTAPPQKLQGRPRTLILLTRYLPAHEANRLIYVCPQLHQETSGLSIRYNDIDFKEILNARVFLVDSACEKDLAHLRRIQVMTNRYSELPGILDGIEGLKRWCFGHPHCTTHLRHATLDDSSGLFLFAAMFIQVWFRVESEIAQVLVPDPHQRALMMEIFENMARTKSVDLSKSAATTPPNFVYFPKNEIFDEEVFRFAAQNNGFMSRRFPLSADGGSLDRWVRSTKELHEHGI
jgi:hypothetical protein